VLPRDDEHHAERHVYFACFAVSVASSGFSLYPRHFLVFN